MRLERNVAVPARRPPALLGEGDPERPDQDPARLGRLDHVVDVAPLGRHVGVRELLGVVLDQARALGDLVARPVELAQRQAAFSEPFAGIERSEFANNRRRWKILTR